MRILGEPVLQGANFIGMNSPTSCRVRLGSCVPHTHGDELDVPVGPEELERVQNLAAGQSVLVVYRGGIPVGLRL